MKTGANFLDELVIDSFACGGGTSEGIEIALGRGPDIAVNHDEYALAMHRANHPGTKHMIQDVATVDAVGMCAGRPIGMLWMSPDCTDHSKAKGAAPNRVGVNTRGIGWAIVGWVKALPKWQRPRVVFLENVGEYVDWSPLLENGKRDPNRKGATFKAFVAAWRSLGYTKIEWRMRRAWKDGAGTIRDRLYMVMRCDDEEIVWPEPTHGNPDDPTDAARIAAGELQPWVRVADCLDFSLPCPSIFDTAAEIKAKHGLRAKRPLVFNTMARVAKGTKRHVIDAARAGKAFVVKVNHTGRDEARDRPADAPLSATTSKRDDALVTPFITKFRSGSVGHAATEPTHTITAHSSETHGGGAAPLGLVAPIIAYAQHGGATRSAEVPVHTLTASPKDQNSLIAVHVTRQFGKSTGRDASDPGGTDMAGGGGKSGVVAAFLAQHNGGPRPGSPAHGADEPVSTIATAGAQQQLVAAAMMTLRGSDRRDAGADEPARTFSAKGQHSALLSLPLMTVYYGMDDDGAPADQPSRTETAKPRFGLVDVLASAPPFTAENEARARQVAEFLRAHGCWNGGEFVTIEINGVTYVLVDIGMRMLTTRERFTANGFPPDYIIDHGIDENGNRIDFSLEQQGYMCGNAVCPPVAAALVRANYRPRQVRAPRRRSCDSVPLFQEAAE
ncbi:DNA (cytosine-5)-methyltransferase 1 [Ancylobacter sp. 3268]|uniref:DNA cytosine methyltransferase n=1 Tax=Ancylobacter sp. 3268 TaxID=2817752 RepID=UPI00285EF343|nr:DNA cytosine methyltransferase [Ancylobacter sp. 3268]MDR6954194.1 DNA (cytosine-5)-methyltransferase 1 [Ancylobacter sp. 3268]